LETPDKRIRCDWVELSGNGLCVPYHDTEWGVPLHDDRRLFEAVVLDGFQAGLSWALMLRKRESFRRAFDGFDAERIARYGREEIDVLLRDAGIIRNRLKIEAAVTNARAFLAVREEHGSFDRYIWCFVDGKPVVNRWKSLKEIPTRSRESDAMSADLKKRGFKFVGTTICYAFMQAVGMVNDHQVSCFRYREILDAG